MKRLIDGEVNRENMNTGDSRSRKVIQATIKVHGRVQKVGYREKVMNVAKYLDLRGFVENLRDPSATDEKHHPVRIVCQGPGPSIEKFAELINIGNGYIDVEETEISYQEQFDLKYYDFHIHRGGTAAEFGSRMDTAIRILERMDDSIRTGNTELKEEISQFRVESNESFRKLGDDLSGFRRESKESFQNLGKEMSSMREELSGLRRESNENFHQLDGKYHTVSEDLKGIRRAVERRLVIEEERAGYTVDGKMAPAEGETGTDGEGRGRKNARRGVVAEEKEKERYGEV